MCKPDFIPSPALKGKFKVVNTYTPLIRFRDLVDLRTVTLEEAEALYDAGFGYLEPIKKSK